jgi:hypothetical protein
MSSMLMPLPFVVFCVMMIAGRKELGWKGIAAFVTAWTAMLAVTMALHIERHFFTAGQAILDVVLISTVYVGFTRLR